MQLAGCFMQTLTLFKRVTQNTAVVMKATSTNQVNHFVSCTGQTTGRAEHCQAHHQCCCCAIACIK